MTIILCFSRMRAVLSKEQWDVWLKKGTRNKADQKESDRLTSILCNNYKKIEAEDAEKQAKGDAVKTVAVGKDTGGGFPAPAVVSPHKPENNGVGELTA